MKKWIIAAAIMLASVSAANAGGLRCEIVQVLPGFFLPQCESYGRQEYRSDYRGNHDRWRYERSVRYDRYGRGHYDRDYYGRKRHPHMDRDIYEKPYRRHNHRW